MPYIADLIPIGTNDDGLALVEAIANFLVRRGAAGVSDTRALPASVMIVVSLALYERDGLQSAIQSLEKW